VTTTLFIAELIAIALVVMVGFGAWGYGVADRKGRWPGEGAILGFLLGPLGVLAAYLLPEAPVPPPPPRPETRGVVDPVRGFIPMERTQERRPRGAARRGR
jgi:hypothetical protein